jgi:hypothetical protein
VDESFVLVPVKRFMATFNVDETAGISDGEMDYATTDVIFDKLCPELGRALEDAVDQFGECDGPEGLEMMRKAVQECWARIRKGDLPVPRRTAS